MKECQTCGVKLENGVAYTARGEMSSDKFYSVCCRHAVERNKPCINIPENMDAVANFIARRKKILDED